MSLVLKMPPVPSKMASQGPQPAAKHFDIVLGFDFHFLKVPWPMTPCPVTPFAAIIFDPMDYIHITLPAMPVYSSAKGFEIARNVPMGGTITINGCYRAAATTGLMALPPMLPIGPMLKKIGFKVKPPNPLHFAIPKAIILINFLAPHDGQISHGSETVFTSQSEQSALMCNVWSCNEMGQVLMNNPMGLFANYATKIIAVLPFGDPVIVGGPFVEHKFKIDDLINALMMMGIMKGAAALLGRILNALLKKLNAFLDAHPNIRAAVQPLICRLLGEPVDVASGHMTSLFQGFNLPGPIPLVWEANYYSNGKYDGPLGRNVYHSYDISLIVDEKAELVVMRDRAGRAVPFTTLKRGDSFFNPMEKLELHRSSEGDYYVADKEGLFYYFTKETDNEGWQKVRSIVNRNGFSIRFFYNSLGHLTKIVDSAYREIDVNSNSVGQITEIKLPHPDIKGEQFTALRYDYDAQGRMTAIYSAKGYKNLLTWKDRFIISRQFPDGNIFTFLYDREGRCYAALGPDNLYSYRFEYQNGLTIVENSLGNKCRYYHNKGIVTSIIDSRGAERTFTYDNFNNMVGEQNAIGNAKGYTFDLRGNATTINLPGSGTTKIEYNIFDAPQKAILPNGAVWEYEYDELGNLLKQINPLGATISYQYNNGLLSSITNDIGNLTKLMYNSQHSLTTVELPNLTSIRYGYNNLGQCVNITDLNRNHQIKEYDLEGNLIKIVEPDDNVRRMRYDAMSNLVEMSDKHNSIELAYNIFGDVTRRTHGGSATYYSYNSEGQLLKLTNQHKEQYSFELDSEGRIVTEIGFDGLTRRYERNLEGQVSAIHRPNGRITRYEYDTSGRVHFIYYNDNEFEEFEYDTFGNIAKARNNEIEVLLQYDLLGMPVTDRQGENSVLSQYNSLGRRTGIRSSLGAAIDLRYDTLMGWIENVHANGWEAGIERTRFGQESKRSVNGCMEFISEYDEIGRLEQQFVIKDKRVQRRHKLKWDADNRLKGVYDSENGSKSFNHDVYGNLSEVIYSGGSVEYRIPDATGNLFRGNIKNEQKYGKGGKLLKAEGSTYKYDEEGNLISKIEKNNRVWNYIWGDNGTLRKVTRPDGEVVEFGYDALRRRIWKRFKNTTTKWVWDADVPLHEWKEFNSKESSIDNLITWVFEEGSFIPAAKIKGDRKHSIVADQIGVPYSMYDANGEKTWECELNSYGAVRMLKGEKSSCPFRFQGQYEDAETELCYNRFRYYDQGNGVYISQDPIRLASNESNFYRYVADPNWWVDPWGLSFGSGRAPHEANVRVFDSNQNLVSNDNLVSGNMRPEEKALGFPQSSLATHTEARAITDIPLRPGDRMEIMGMYAPCPSCQGKMRKASSNGNLIEYNWTEDGIHRRMVYQNGKKIKKLCK